MSEQSEMVWGRAQELEETAKVCRIAGEFAAEATYVAAAEQLKGTSLVIEAIDSLKEAINENGKASSRWRDGR